MRIYDQRYLKLYIGFLNNRDLHHYDINKHDLLHYDINKHS